MTKETPDGTADVPEGARLGGAAAAAGEEFSLQEAVGGWRGMTEAALPGATFVTTFIIWGGFKIPTIAALAVVAVLVIARLIQRTPITQAVSGVFGVVLGAIWAWRVGDAIGYFVPGFWMTGGLAVAVAVSMVVRWPAVGIVVAMVRGWDSSWRQEPALMRRFQWATLVYVVSQLIRLAVQLPLYFAGATAALGTAKLALGLPYYALTLWVIWWMVRNAKRAEDLQDQPQPTQ